MSSPRYQQVLEFIFEQHFKEVGSPIFFSRDEIDQACVALGIARLKNFGDLIYTFRYRANFPDKMTQVLPPGHHWILFPDGKAKYRLEAVQQPELAPSPALIATKIPDATPSIILSNGLSDEQALLARLRYNRLVDTFLGITCYSLQNHLRTTVSNMGQIEIDEMYIGVDRHGGQHIIPVQAKGGKDRISSVQILQDIACCESRFPLLRCQPIGAQFIGSDKIGLFLFRRDGNRILIELEKQYKLVPAAEISESDLQAYNTHV